MKEIITEILYNTEVIKRFMKRLLYPLTTLISIAMVKAQLMDPFGGNQGGRDLFQSLIPSVAGQKGTVVVFMIVIVYFFIKATFGAALERMGQGKNHKVVYFILTAAVIYGGETQNFYAGFQNFNSIIMLIVLIFVTTKVLPHITMSKGVMHRGEEKREKKEHKKIKNQVKLDKHSDELMRKLDEHEESLEHHRDQLENAEKAEIEDIEEKIKEAIKYAKEDKEIKKFLKKIRKKSAKAQNPEQAQELADRARGLEQKARALERALQAKIEEINKEEQDEEQKEQTEESEVEQEETETEEEVEEEKKEVKREKKEEKKEKELAHDKYLDPEERQAEAKLESDLKTEVNFDKKKLKLEEEKQHLIYSTRTYKGNKTKADNKIQELRIEAESSNNYDKIKKNLEKIEKLEQDKLKYGRRIDNNNQELENINRELENLEDMSEKEEAVIEEDSGPVTPS